MVDIANMQTLYRFCRDNKIEILDCYSCGREPNIDYCPVSNVIDVECKSCGIKCFTAFGIPCKSGHFKWNDIMRTMSNDDA